MTQRTRWRPKPRMVERPTQGAIRTWDAVQSPPRTCPECGGEGGAHQHLPAQDENGKLVFRECRLGQFAPTRPAERQALDRLTKGKAGKVSQRGGSEKLAVPTEQEEHRNLAAWIRLQWWAKGARRLESQASRGVREQAQLSQEGGEFLSGNPDWMFFIPEQGYREALSGHGWRDEMTLAVELKRRDVGKTRPHWEWWLTDDWPWQENGEVENPRSEHYGLTWSQACALRSMHAAGVRTYVAYGWDDAARWLEEQIGPRPAVEPDWGW